MYRIFQHAGNLGAWHEIHAYDSPLDAAVAWCRVAGICDGEAIDDIGVDLPTGAAFEVRKPNGLSTLVVGDQSPHAPSLHPEPDAIDSEEPEVTGLDLWHEHRGRVFVEDDQRPSRLVPDIAGRDL